MFDALGLDGCAGFVDAGFDLEGEGGLVGFCSGVEGAFERGGGARCTYGIVDHPFYGY